MDLTTCSAWRGRRLWVRVLAAAMTRRYGTVESVFPPALQSNDVELGVRFDDEAYTTVRASQKGRVWDFAD